MFSYLFCIIDVLCIYRKCFIVFIVNDSYPNNSSLTRTYDSLRRLTTKVFTPTSNAKDANKLYTTYSYVTKDDTINDKKVKLGSLLVDTYTNKFGNKGKAVSSYKYAYDNWGNISSIIDNNNNIEEYTYDNDNQLVKATYKNNNEIISTYDYSYDNGGNILSKTINGKTIHYEYSNSFKDELTSYDGKSITYNKSGYPVSYMGDEMSFDYAGHLTSIKASGNSTLTLNNNDEVSFTYSDTGNRLSKTYNDEIVKYIYNNDLLLKEIHNNYELSFIYDYSYNITSLIYKDLNTNIETSYFFTFNNQGDVKSIYRSSDLKLIGTYDYDPYGNIISINDELIDDNDIINKNPIRYRGYYLDTESGLYYLKARYYDSNVGRFISIDSFDKLDPYSIVGLNLYAYCGSNPVVREDSKGEFWDTVLDVGFLIWDIYELSVNEGYRDWKNWVALGIDVAFTALPFVTGGGGKVIKLADVADDMTDFSKATVIGENMDRVYKTADDLGIAAKELYKGFDNYEKLERSGKMGKCIAEVCGKTDNAVWITNKLRNNYKIIDIGADLSKGVHKISKSCQVEHAAIKVWETRNIWKLSYHLPSLTK